MKLHRLIPVLTFFENKLVKTTNFNIKNSIYLGDVLNAVRLFNDKKAEELMICDIGATINKTEPNFELIKKISSVSRMPICYSGGISNMKQVMKITSFGVEKISVSTHALNNILFLKNISHKIGRQSLSVTINIKKIDDQYSIFSHNGKKKYEGLLLDFIYQIKDIVGEIIINDIDKDGTMNGINTEILEIINHHISVPLIIIGGAGSINHVREVINKNHIIGVGCASLFVFKGKNKAVLINYPKDQIFRNL